MPSHHYYNCLYLGGWEGFKNMGGLLRMISFLVSSFASAIPRSYLPKSMLADVWKIEAPSRVVAFGWLALHGEF